MNAVDNGQFNGFLLYPQLPSDDPTALWTTGDWLVKVREIVIEMIRDYNVDPQKIVITGLSNGGYGVWGFLTRYPQLVAAAVPTSDDNANTGNASTLNDLINVPLWHGQGGADHTSTSLAEVAKGRIDDIRGAGGYIRAVYFPTGGHGIWNNTWAKPEYFPFMSFGNKTNIVIRYSHSPDYTTTNAPTTEHLCSGESVNLTLSISGGYEAYQWKKDGVIIQGATSNTLHVTALGSYQVSFQWPSLLHDQSSPGRTYSVPGYSDTWTEWSAPVVIDDQREKTDPVLISAQNKTVNLPGLDGSSSVALHAEPNQYGYLWHESANPISGSNDSIFTTPDAGLYQTAVRTGPGRIISYILSRIGVTTLPLKTSTIRWNTGSPLDATATFPMPSRLQRKMA